MGEQTKNPKNWRESVKIVFLIELPFDQYQLHLTFAKWAVLMVF